MIVRVLLLHVKNFWKSFLFCRLKMFRKILCRCKFVLNLFARNKKVLWCHTMCQYFFGWKNVSWCHTECQYLLLYHSFVWYRKSNSNFSWYKLFSLYEIVFIFYCVKFQFYLRRYFKYTFWILFYYAVSFIFFFEIN